jgi:hypothetical protein
MLFINAYSKMVAFHPKAFEIAAAEDQGPKVFVDSFEEGLRGRKM